MTSRTRTGRPATTAGGRTARGATPRRPVRPPHRGRRTQANEATPTRASAKLSRGQLERALAELSEQNERLRDEVRAQQALWEIAHQDPLTGLWNRRYADGRLAQELSRAKRETQHRFSMVLIDVDNLKRINDTTGHAGGDRALRWVASFIKQRLRGHDLCCRIGGDEFLLILPASGQQECHDLVARLRRRWQASAETDPNAVPISLGTASFPVQGTTADVLLGVADRAMYEDKRRGDRRRHGPTARHAHTADDAKTKTKPPAPPAVPAGLRTRLVSI